MGLLNGILKGIRNACDALIDEEEESKEEIRTEAQTEAQTKAQTEAGAGVEEKSENGTEGPEQTGIDPYRRGKQFEDWALRLFPAESFNIIHKTVGGADLDGRYTEDCVYPDYKFRDRATRQEFWVECKYRSRRGEKGNLEWTDMKHLRRYQAIRKETGTPVFVLVGIGGTPEDPNELLFFNLDKAGYATLFYSVQKDMRLESRPYGSLGEMCEGNKFAA